MANLGITLKQLAKSVKKGTHPIADYIKFEREMAGIPFDVPISGDEIRRARNVINPKREQFVEPVIHTNRGKYDDEATKFLSEHGYNEKGDFDLIQPIEENLDDFADNIPTYPVDEEKSNKLLQSIRTREKLLQYTKTKDPQTYKELATVLHEYPTQNVNQRYKQVANWLDRANKKYKEIINPSGPKRQLSYANKRYTNMDSPINGEIFNTDYDIFDLEDYAKRDNISDPYLKSYLENEIRKLNPKDAYDAALIKQLEQKL